MTESTKEFIESEKSSDEIVDELSESVLVEGDVPARLEIGETYGTPEGTVTIENIVVDGFHYRPSTFVFYSYKWNSGRSGKERNTVDAFRKLFN